MRLDLPGRTVVVTGASGGLGAGLARALRARGAQVALLDLHTDRVHALTAQLGGDRYARGWGVDVRDLDGLQQVMDEVADHFGAIDVVVAGAGVLGPLRTIGPTSAAEWDRVIEVNLGGVWRTLKAAAPHVARRGGHLMAISSMIAYIHPPLLGSYAASKAGVAALCDVLRLEMRAVGVTVGSVHPVIFRTPLIGDALSSPAATELIRDFTGVFKTVPLDTVIAGTVRAIERRSPRVTVPRRHHAATLIPGLAQSVLEKLAFRPRAVARAIQLGSATDEPTPSSAAPTAAPGGSPRLTAKYKQ
jgi:NAD(P)-dependent dehydrogenase (short-subunit alcohol dehydrogenase family)